MTYVRKPSLELAGGSPGAQPCTFTRFLLPFAWRLSPLPGGSGAAWQRNREFGAGRIDANERQGYFTAEVSKLLFERAWRYNWTGEACPQFKALRPVELVLFEADHAGDDDLLKIGMVVLELAWPSNPNLVELLQANHFLRFVAPLFDKFDAEFAAFIAAFDSTQPNPGPNFRHWLHDLLMAPVADGGIRQQLCLEPDRFVWPDKRMFTHSCAVYRLDGALLPPLEHQHQGFWINLLNIDKGLDEPTEFELDWAKLRTYTRWQHYGALYGFTTHSAVMWTAACAEPPTWQHFRTIYYDQSCLLLYVRCVLFAFSARISKEAGILRSARRASEKRAARAALSSLDYDFALFVNLYQFPLLSNQQQGLELYALQRAQMDINDLFVEVQSEVDHSRQIGAERRNERLQWIAILIAVVALIQSIGTVKEYLAERMVACVAEPSRFACTELLALAQKGVGAWEAATYGVLAVGAVALLWYRNRSD